MDCTLLFADELAVLAPDRRKHCEAVGAKAVAEAWRVEPALRADLVVAAALHDIGYGHPLSGFHAWDGARYLASRGFSPVVSCLVVNHSASRLEAEERGLDLTLFDDFAAEKDLTAAHAVVWWADMTTGPQGQTVTEEARLAEIVARYGAGDVVTRFIERARPALLAAGQPWHRRPSFPKDLSLKSGSAA